MSDTVRCALLGLARRGLVKACVVVQALLVGVACVGGQASPSTDELVHSGHPDFVLANGVYYKVDCELFVRFPAVLGSVEGTTAFRGSEAEWLYLSGYDEALLGVEGTACGEPGRWAVGKVEGYPYPCEFSDDPTCES